MGIPEAKIPAEEESNLEYPNLSRTNCAMTDLVVLVVQTNNTFVLLSVITFNDRLCHYGINQVFYLFVTVM